jgi:hypothetical protein
MITAEIEVSLEREPDHDDPSRDRRALGVLEQCPDGAVVRVRIGRRRFISQDAAVFLHEQDHRLVIIIVGVYPDVVGRFVQAARAGEWAVI